MCGIVAATGTIGMDEVERAARQYFQSVRTALDGFGTYLASRDRETAARDFADSIVMPYVERLKASFECWENRIGFIERFRISRAESGYPVYQNVLELENDKRGAETRLASIPTPDQLRAGMADFILRNKAFPDKIQAQMAERLYLEHVMAGDVFSPVVLPVTSGISVNAKTMRPSVVVDWGVFDGTQALPMIYIARIEDSSDNMVRMLVAPDGTLNREIDIPLPVGGYLNPDLASKFDDFVLRNSGYSLTPVTIATNLDTDFPLLHPKLLRRIVLGPFYSAGITENNGLINQILAKVRKPENAWLLTWTVQEVFSKNERPARKGFFSTTPASEEFHIDTNNLEAARMGVSAYEKHALVPHEAYQALYASGEAKAIFGEYKVHVISGNQVTSEV